MPRWTPEQEALLRSFANKGAAYCAELIARETHVRRTPEATSRHANRMGLLMVRRETCPSCGSVVARLNRNTGLCPTCNMRVLAQRQRELRARLESEARDGDYQRAHRDYDANRKAAQRLRRDCGDSVDMSGKMSSPWSGAREISQDPPPRA